MKGGQGGEICVQAGSTLLHWHSGTGPRAATDKRARIREAGARKKTPMQAFLESIPLAKKKTPVA